MEELPRYEIQYTDSAIQDISNKAEYIADQFLDPPLALRWYERLRREITEDLTVLPYKYPVYDAVSTRHKDVRLFLTRNDVVLYSVNEEKRTVYIRNVFTRGKDISAYLNDE